MKNLNNQKSCCEKGDRERKEKGFLAGLLYGLLPHSFCIAFIIFSIIGATTASVFFKKFLLNPYFFYILVGLSFIFATISAIIYLKRNYILSFQGIKRKWKYLSILYGTTISVNLILFMVIFPFAANIDLKSIFSTSLAEPFNLLSFLTLEVNIPCSGHAPLISGELKKINGIKDVKFRFPNLFEIKYNPKETSVERIISLEVFNTYKANIKK